MFAFDLHLPNPDFVRFLQFFTSFFMSSYFFVLVEIYCSLFFDFCLDLEFTIDKFELFDIIEFESPNYTFLGLERDI